MASKTATHPVLGTRELNRATLARQLLLRRAQRAEMPVAAAVAHLVGLQAQNVKPPYYALDARLEAFDPQELSTLMEAREVGRIVTMRSTIHTHTADDCLGLRPLVQPARDRELAQFRAGLVGVDLQRLALLARELVEDEPRTMKELRDALLAHWPDADPFALSVAARCSLPLVQVTPRGLWGRSGQVRLTTAERWFGRPSESEPDAEDAVRRYLAAFGPASVKDFQTWSGLTRTREVFERLRPGLAVFQDEYGVELFDLPDAPRPAAGTPAPARLLPEFDNLLLSHADRRRVVSADHKGLTWRGNQAYRTFLLDGFLAGIWGLEETGDAATVTLQPFDAPTRAQREELEGEAERMLRTMRAGASHEVRFGRVGAA